MSATEVANASLEAAAGNFGMHLEVQIIPVSDVDRARQFYRRLDWPLDADAAPLDGLRIVQFTPPSRLGGLGHVRHRTHHRGARLGRGRAGRLRHRSGPRRPHRPRHRRERDLARPAVPPRSPPARPRPRTHQLRVVLLRRRSRRQHLAGPGGHRAAPRPDRCRSHGIRVYRGPGQRAAAGGAAHAEHHKRTRRPHLFHHSGQDENWAACYAACLAAEQAGTALPTRPFFGRGDWGNVPTAKRGPR